MAAWTAVRPGLAALADRGPGVLPPATMEAFTGGCLALLSHAPDESLPMAERLRSDAQLECLARDLRGSAALHHGCG